MKAILNPIRITNCKNNLLIDESVMSNIQFFGWDMDEKIAAETL